LKISLGKKNQLETPRRLKLFELKGVKAQEYAVKVANRFEALGILQEDRSPKELWKKSKEILLDVALATVALKDATSEKPGFRRALLSLSRKNGKQNEVTQQDTKN